MKQKKDKELYTLCEGWDCKLKEECDRYCPTMVKAKTDHFALCPYKPDRNYCGFFKIKPEDPPFILPPTN